MLKLFQISIEANINSVGRIAEQIGLSAINNGWESYLTYSRSMTESKSKIIRIGSRFDIYRHVIYTRLFDRHCLSSSGATKHLVGQMEEIDPDIILLHHIHGYFIDMRVLFEYLAKADKPVIWVFHDCWAFTGHCAHFDDCLKWQTHCNNCPLNKKYPASLFADRSYKNFELKKSLFNSVRNLTIVSVSEWMNSLVKQSFLKHNNLICIPNGINTDIFCIRDNRNEICTRYGINQTKKYIIGVASTWTESKGLLDFIKLRQILSDDVQIVLVGLSPRQIKELPVGIIGIKRTSNVDELASLYSGAEIFINPTHHDTFPTVNIEAQACGTPVVTYDSGGAPEIIENLSTGIVVKCGQIVELEQAVSTILNSWDLEECKIRCRKRVEEKYDYKKNFNKYIALFNRRLNLDPE